MTKVPVGFEPGIEFFIYDDVMEESNLNCIYDGDDFSMSRSSVDKERNSFVYSLLKICKQFHIHMLFTVH